VEKNGSPVIDKTFSARYKDVEGKTVDEQLTEWGKFIKRQMQDAIDAYVNEHALSSNPKLDTALNVIKNGLDVSEV
jgi:hypothetical protein